MIKKRERKILLYMYDEEKCLCEGSQFASPLLGYSLELEVLGMRE